MKAWLLPWLACAVALWAWCRPAEACLKYWGPPVANPTKLCNAACSDCGRSGSVDYAAFSCVKPPTDKPYDCKSCHDARDKADCDEGIGDGYSLGYELAIRTDPLKRDVDECAHHLDDCSPMATCTDDVTQRGHFTCQCPPGYKGDGHGADGCTDDDECDKGVDPCDPSRPGHPHCKNYIGDYACPCTAPYFGDARIGDGCTLEDACAESPCSPLSICVPISGDPGYLCRGCESGADCGHCPPGYDGEGEAPDGCVDKNECASDSPPCSPLTTCTNYVGGYTCSACPEGYDGTGYTECTPKPSCQGVSCGEHEHCQPAAAVGVPGTCACDPGFALVANACEDVDECEDPKACGAGTSCENVVGYYRCLCPDGRVTGADGKCHEPPMSQGPQPVGGAGSDEPMPSSRGGTGADDAGPSSGAPANAPANQESSGCSAAPNYPTASGGWLVLTALLLVTSLRRAASRRRLPSSAWAALALAVLLALGCSSDRNINVDSTGQGGASDTANDGGASAAEAGAVAHAGSSNTAASPPCRHSRDCQPDEWCNPGTQACESRRHPGASTWAEVAEFVHVNGCPACHVKGESGAVDLGHSGKLALFDDDERELYDTFVAGGVSCGQHDRRLCVDDPASSLLMQKLHENPNLPAEEQPSALFADWVDPRAQSLLRWIAQGAVREVAPPTCGDFVLDSGEQCDLGPTPPASCAYGLGSCWLCNAKCKKLAGTGPRCGDGRTDAPEEACDEASSSTEVGPRGGVACVDCHYVAGKLCGAYGLPCCESGDPCEAGSFCQQPEPHGAGVPSCQPCGHDRDGEPCCPEDACVGDLVCRTQGPTPENTEKRCRQPCGLTNEACCTYDSQEAWCADGRRCDADYWGQSAGICVCGEPEQPCCPGEPGQPNTCNDRGLGLGFGNNCNAENLCEPCGDIYERCCPTGSGCPFPGMCNRGWCEPHPCGRKGQLCCTDFYECDPDLTCMVPSDQYGSWGECAPCGHPGELCCDGFCNETDCDFSTGLCLDCGGLGEPCPIVP